MPRTRAQVAASKRLATFQPKNTLSNYFSSVKCEVPTKRAKLTILGDDRNTFNLEQSPKRKPARLDKLVSPTSNHVPSEESPSKSRRLSNDSSKKSPAQQAVPTTTGTEPTKSTATRSKVQLFPNDSRSPAKQIVPTIEKQKQTNAHEKPTKQLFESPLPMSKPLKTTLKLQPVSSEPILPKGALFDAVQSKKKLDLSLLDSLEWSGDRFKVPKVVRNLPKRTAKEVPIKPIGRPQQQQQQHQQQERHEQKEKLPLPASLESLYTLFRCADNVLSLYYNRSEICTFRLLKKAVEGAERKNFTLTHLGQFLALDEKLYRVKYEKNLIENGVRSSAARLAIRPQLEQFVETGNADGQLKKFCYKLLDARRNHVRQLLLERVKSAHDEFLLGRNLPSPMALSSLTQWHEQFRLDTVPPIRPAALPAPPADDNRVKSARQMIEQSQEKLAPQIRDAMEKIATTQRSESVENVAKTSAAKPAATKSYNALLERIRSKERLKWAESAVNGTEEERRRRELINDLPDLAYRLRALFDREKPKKSLRTDFVIDSMRRTTGRSPDKIRQQLDLLSAVLRDGDGSSCCRRFSNFFVELPLLGGRFFQLKMDVDVKEVVEFLKTVH